MKTTFAVMAAVAMFTAGCSTVQAKRSDGGSYTCVPNDARNRGPTQPIPAQGASLTVK
jgi:hypothetical protein